jgi:ABC-2 type transport system permease protein
MVARLVKNARGAYTIWYRDVLRYLRDKARIVGSLGQPLLFLFIFGTGLTPVMSALGGGNLDFRQFVFPGILAMSVMFTALFSAVSIVWDREFGFLKEVMVAPVSRIAVVIGKVGGGATVALFQGAIILLLSPILGIRLSVGQIVSLIGIMLLLAAMVTSIGILIASRQKSMEGFQMIMNFIMLPMFFLSGALFPLREVPLWMEVLSTVDPVTYGVDPLRAVALENLAPKEALNALVQHPIAVNVGVMLGLSLLFIVPAAWLFSKRD